MLHPQCNICFHVFIFLVIVSFTYSVNDLSNKENLGIIVQYKVKVKLCLGPLGADVVAELPFILMHPKPEEVNIIDKTLNSNNSQENHDPQVHTNLIQLE